MYSFRYNKSFFACVWSLKQFYLINTPFFSVQVAVVYFGMSIYIPFHLYILSHFLLIQANGEPSICLQSCNALLGTGYGYNI